MRAKVLLASPSFAPAFRYGGPIVSSLGLCEALCRLGCGVKVITTDAAGGGAVLGSRLIEQFMIEQFNSSGISVVYCKTQFGEDIAPGFPWHLWAGIRWADMVLVNGVYSPHVLVAMIMSRMGSRPVVWIPRGSFQQGQPGRRLKRLWLRILEFWASRDSVLMMTSDAEIRDSSWALPFLRRMLVPNGVSIPVREVAFANTGSIRLVFVGRLHPVKDLPLLFRSLALCRRQFGKSVQLLIIGTGTTAYESELRASLDELSVADLVSFAGPVDGEPERIAQFDRCDLGVLVSKHENFGNSIAEMAAAGLPVIVSENLPWNEVTSKGCGYVVPRSAEAIAMRLSSLNRPELERMGARARIWMREEYDWSARAELLLRETGWLRA
jgi:glycosyltransferase involved in cell wall biosynthesis